MRNNLAFKFIAIALCALCLMGAIGGAAGIIGLSSMDLYNKTVDEYLAQEVRGDAALQASELALNYASKMLGGCPEDMLQAQAQEQYGGEDWFYRQYPSYGYTITDSEGKVLSSYNVDDVQGRTAYPFQETGNYMHLVEVIPMNQSVQIEEDSRAVAVGEEYLYDAISPMGDPVYSVTIGYDGGSMATDGGDSSIGFVFYDADGRVVFRCVDAVMEIESTEVNYLRLEDVNGGILYEISSSEPVGFLSNDENGFLTFTGNPPVADEPMALAEETTVETTVETLAPVETEATAAAEETAAPETAAEAATEETAASSASAIPEEIGETVWEETQAPTTEATVPPTTEATVPPTTVPVETVPDIEVTEPVMIHDKPLSSYQVNRMEYYDSTLGETVTAKYVYVPMPELTVTLYVDTTEVGYPGVWDLVRIVQHLRQYLLPMAALCLLGFAVLAVYLCSAAGCKPGIPEIRAGGLNRIPLDLYLVGGGCLVAGFVAGGVALTGYLAQSDLFTACCAGLLLVYLGCLVFVGFCYAVVAQIKTPGGFWWRNTLCGWILRLCARFAKWLESCLSVRLLPWLGRFGKKLWVVICNCASWLEKRVNRFISYLPLVWQWLLAGGACLLLVFASDGSFWSIILWALLICYGAYCFGKLMDSVSRMSKGDLNIKVDDKHMVGAFSQFAQSLNNLANVTVDAARKQLKSERMKTELITNVSHDIKTPLTSIINYVDLLQKAQTEQERQEYLEVLDRQSQRLKKLIEDLMDMSKASTGNMTVDITRVDAVESVNQALGEFADKLDRAMLSPVFRHDEDSMPMMADGRLVWRVLSNLLGNAVKYALPGTRLYIDLARLEGNVVLSVKNISREELNVDADELMERFVRGDDSRNTEGSGLGLNIAKSLMELQKGELQLLVDGDLFKVTLIFPGA